MVLPSWYPLESRKSSMLSSASFLPVTLSAHAASVRQLYSTIALGPLLFPPRTSSAAVPSARTFSRLDTAATGGGEGEDQTF